MPIRRVLALFVAVPLFAATFASAASMGGIASSSLGAGDAVVGRCDTAITATLVVSGTTITAVNVTDIAAPCVGGSLSLVVTASGTELARGGPVVVTGPAVVVPVSPVSGVGATDVRAVIVGP